MVRVADIHPLTHFLRDHKAHLERLRASGRPEVLTVNGQARVVVQDAEAYQRLVEQVEQLETERVLRERLASLENGEAGVSVEQVLADIRQRLGFTGG